MCVGQNVSDLGKIDGTDMWSALVTGSQSPRTEFVHNIDDLGDKYAALRWTDWKYIKGINIFIRQVLKVDKYVDKYVSLSLGPYQQG